jgi:hypothetical protein
MSRGQQNKLYNQFVKGLITEAGPLTYPENASTDELNCVLKRKGSRARRLGIDYEPDSAAATPSLDYDDTALTNEFLWKAVDNNSDINFLCFQIGSTVRFFDVANEPIASGLKTFEIDLLDYKVSTATDEQVAISYAQFAGGKGLLFIVNPYIEPIVVEYDQDDDDITVIPITIQIRDFDGIYDGLANDAEPTTLSKEHYYNLRNQGWVAPGSSVVGPDGGETIPTPPDELPGGPGSYDPWQGGQYEAAP